MKKAKVKSYKARLHNALVTVATLIENGNEALWPLFDKLEKEMNDLNQRQNRLTKYTV